MPLYAVLASTLFALTTTAAPAAGKSTVPALKNVKTIRIVARAYGDGASRCEFNAGRQFRANTIARLKKIDWSQKGVGLERIQIIKPDIELTVIEKNGKKHRYEFYWRHKSFLDHDSNRMLQVDTEFLRIDVIGEIIRHYGNKKK